MDGASPAPPAASSPSARTISDAERRAWKRTPDFAATARPPVANCFAAGFAAETRAVRGAIAAADMVMVAIVVSRCRRRRSIDARDDDVRGGVARDATRESTSRRIHRETLLVARISGFSATGWIRRSIFVRSV